MASSNQSSSFFIEKLVGRDNFTSWKFAMRALLEHEDLWNCIEGTETNEKKIAKAKSKIILSVDPVNYVHIQEVKTAKEAWEKLTAAFEDSGLTRKVGLLRTLVTTRLDSSESVDQYVNKIISTAHKLNDLGFKVNDEWVGTLLLAGLPEIYSPMIMGLESSGTAITGDSIKTKILQDVHYTKTSRNSNSMSALYIKKDRNKFDKEKARCYECNKIGHLARECRTKKVSEKLDSKSNKQDQSSSNSSQRNRQKDTEKRSDPKRCFYAFTTTDSNINQGDWYIDSCASSHMTLNTAWLENQRSVKNTEFLTANNTKMLADKAGDVNIYTQAGSNTNEILVKDVIYVPDAAANLLSISKVVEKGNVVNFSKDGCKIFSHENEVIAEGICENGIYKLVIPDNKKLLYTALKVPNLWHRRLGHLNRKNMKKLEKLSTGFKVQDYNTEPCEACIKGKHARFPFKKSASSTKNVLEVIHSDLCGPMENLSIGGSKYILTFIDDYSRYTFVYFLQNKSEVPDVFERFKKFVENQTDRKIKTLRTDNGSEYVNYKLKKSLDDSGIKHQLTVPYSPQQNGTAERMNRTIVEKARSMLSDAIFPVEYWAEAVSTAVYLINRSPTAATGKTPYERWYKRKPDLSHLKIFGCKAMVHIPDEKRKKWDVKSKQYTFLGYPEDVKGYKLIDGDKNIIISRDVIFFETENGQEKEKLNRQENNTEAVELIEEEEETSIAEEERNSLNTTAEPTDSSDDTLCTQDISWSSDATIEFFEQSTDENPVRRSSRQPKPIDMSDYVTFLTYSTDPENIEEAMKCEDKDEWLGAMRSEYDSLKENETFTLVCPPEGRKILQTKWVFRTKRNEQGDIQRHKARLVIKGCAQAYGVDYEETYSPVVRYSSLRFIFALAAKYKMMMHHMDVTTAYLQGELEEDIYVKQPKEFTQKGHENKVWKLRKAMYGLKQSGRVWNRKLTKTLKKLNLQQSKADQCMFFKRSEGKLMIIAIYVDDMLIACNDINLLNETKKDLMREFKMKDLGEAVNILGIRIKNDRANGIVEIDQSVYTNDILQKFGMNNCKPVLTPTDPNQKFETNTAESKRDKWVPYQEAIGSLLYLSQATRPDISFATGVLSRFANNQTEEHWKAVKRIFRYLKGTTEAKLVYKNEDKKLEGYSDADWGNEINNRHSMTGSIFKLQDGAISWCSKKQRTVALSTTEAEYIALSATAQEAIWLRQLSLEIDPSSVNGAIVIFSDNKAAVDLAQTSGYRQRTKHIDIRHHFLREKIESGEIFIKHIPTEEMVADSLTKGLFREKHIFCAEGMGLSLHNSKNVQEKVLEK